MFLKVFDFQKDSVESFVQPILNIKKSIKYESMYIFFNKAENAQIVDNTIVNSVLIFDKLFFKSRLLHDAS